MSDDIISFSFLSHFHAATGRPRKHLLYPMLRALLLQLIFSIPTTSLLIVFLKYSQELRDFCGFDVIPDASKFTRFKQDFLPSLQSMFEHMVDLTEPICQRIDKQKASMILFDTSGIEAWVTENNPNYANRIIRQLKTFKKAQGSDTACHCDDRRPDTSAQVHSKFKTIDCIGLTNFIISWGLFVVPAT